MSSSQKQSMRGFDFKSRYYQWPQQELFQEHSVVHFAGPSVPPVLKLPGDSTVHETMKTLESNIIQLLYRNS